MYVLQQSFDKLEATYTKNVLSQIFLTYEKDYRGWYVYTINRNGQLVGRPIDIPLPGSAASEPKDIMVASIEYLCKWIKDAGYDVNPPPFNFKYSKNIMLWEDDQAVLDKETVMYVHSRLGDNDE